MSWARLGLPKQRGGLGFRDSEVFNLALLAKQGWRLIQQPNSLLAKVLKGKYFQMDSFLQAKLGANPYFTWRSMLKARPLLEQGLIWRIGNGEWVRIWRDEWIPSSTDHRVHSPVQILPPDAPVATLLNSDSGWWNYNLIHDIFNPVDAANICCVVLSPMSHEDKLIWTGSKKGCFTV
jgi:hypothetical protein